MSLTKNLWQSRVEAGVRLLDQRHPGWYWEVEPDKVRMGSCGQCVLGQLYGLFNSAVVALGIPAQARRYAFIADHPWQYPLLDRLWKEALLDKRQTDPPVAPSVLLVQEEKEEALLVGA